MPVNSYTTQKTFIDNNINTNGVGSITGAFANTALATYLLKNQPYLKYDITRPSLEDAMCVYHDGTRYNIYICHTAYGAGAFDNTKWTRITQIKEILTTNNNAFDGIEVGANIYAHTVGVEELFIYAIKDTTNANIPLNIISVTNTLITITSLEQYVDARIIVLG